MAMIGKKVVSKGHKHSTVSSAYKAPHPSHHKKPHPGAATGTASKPTYRGPKKSGMKNR